MDEDKKLERRVVFADGVLQTREVREAEDKDAVRTIEGVAIVTEQETVLCDGPDYREIEVIDKSCLNDEFMAEQDVKLNLLHERSMSLARNKMGSGTLKLEVKEDGLHFEAPVPDCDLGKRALALIDNGTYTGCSFEFWPQDYTVDEREGEDGKTEYVIRHTAFKKLGAVTIGMDPAYEQTSIGFREAIVKDRDEDGFSKKSVEEGRGYRERQLRLSGYCEEN